MPLPDGRTLVTTAVPARHGPVTIEALTGHVTGFVLSIEASKDIYVSGDTVWFSGPAEIARRFDVGLAVLFAGVARPGVRSTSRWTRTMPSKRQRCFPAGSRSLRQTRATRRQIIMERCNRSQALVRARRHQGGDDYSLPHPVSFSLLSAAIPEFLVIWTRPWFGRDS